MLHQIPDPEGGCELIEGTVEIPTKVVSHSVRVRDHHHFWLATTPPSWKEIELEPLVIRFKFRGSHVSDLTGGGRGGIDDASCLEFEPRAAAAERES